MGEDKKGLKPVSYKLSQEHKEKLAILKAHARKTNTSDYLMELIDKEYSRVFSHK